MYYTDEIAERIKSSLKAKKQNMRDMLSTLNLGINAISEFSKGKIMSCISLAKIADYLDCSVDYLLGRTDNPSVITTDDVDIIAKLRVLTDEERAEVISFINSLIFSREHTHIDVAAESGKRYTTTMTTEEEHEYALEQENNNK